MSPNRIVLSNMKLNVLAMTNCTMLGSACFLVGSVLYLPTIGCEEFAVRVGTWLFIGGSALFVLAGVLPLVNAQLNKVLGAPTPMYEVVVHGNVRLKRARPTPCDKTLLGIWATLVRFCRRGRHHLNSTRLIQLLIEIIDG